MQRHRDDDFAGELLAHKAFLQHVAERPGERHAISVLQMVNDLAKRLGEEQRGAGEVESVFPSPA
jgi:hypothetical protein